MSPRLDVEILHDLGNRRLIVRICGTRSTGRDNDATYLVEPLPHDALQWSRWSLTKQQADEAYEVAEGKGPRGIRCSCPNFPFRRRNQVIPGVCRHVQALRQLGLFQSPLEKDRAARELAQSLLL